MIARYGGWPSDGTTGGTMASRIKVACDRPYPFEQDETYAGRRCRIPGRRGVFKVYAYETNPRTGAAWWRLIGPQTAGDPGQWTHVREINLIPEKRSKR